MRLSSFIVAQGGITLTILDTTAASSDALTGVIYVADLYSTAGHWSVYGEDQTRATGPKPESGADVAVPEKRFPHFRPGKPMHERLNGGG